jgi:GT2 family glycosyltransferase
MSIDVSVIIVNWNTRRLLEQCLSSLSKCADGVQLEVIVVDNASEDDSVQYVAQHFPEVRLIHNSVNRGFAAANNQGLAIAKGRNILFLNSDTIVHQGALKAMAKLLDNTPDVGLCSCRLLNEDGSIQPNVHHFPSFGAMLQRYTIFKHPGLFKAARAFYKMRDFPYDKTVPVDQVMGAVLMVKKELLEQIGNMDEKLFFYFEETDLCYRVKQAGFKVYFTPDGEITHIGRASSALLGSHKVHAMFFKSMFHYFRKTKGKVKTFLFSCLFKPGVCLYMLCEMILGFCSVVVFWCLRRNVAKIRRRFERCRESFLFLAKYGMRFLFF